MDGHQDRCLNSLLYRKYYMYNIGARPIFQGLIYRLQLQWKETYRTVNPTLEATTNLPPTGPIFIYLSLSHCKSFVVPKP
jgi:hypothetical protein